MDARLSILAAGVAALSLAACTAPDRVGSPTPSASPAPATHIAVSTIDSSIGLSALITGRLALSRSGCWELDTTPVIFPIGTTVQPDGSGITLRDGTDVDVGTAITSGGGWGTPDASTKATIPPECMADSLAAMNTDGITID